MASVGAFKKVKYMDQRKVSQKNPALVESQVAVTDVAGIVKVERNLIREKQ